MAIQGIFVYNIMQSFVVSEIIVPLRAEPNHKSEQVSQLLFAEKVFLVEEYNQWLKVETEYDQYLGFAELKMLVPDNSSQSNDKEPLLLVASTLGKARATESMLNLVMGCTLPQYSAGKFMFSGQIFQYEGDVNAAHSVPAHDTLIMYALKYLQAPYLWGGRTPFGIDCSGFVQMAYKFCNYKLPRDASQQATKGIRLDKGDTKMKGDLAFFHNEKGNITHVGIMLDSNRIIHASGKVRIDTLNENGIYNHETSQTTHSLSHIQRILPTP